MTPSSRVAVVGMSGRFPGAATLDQFWDNLVAGADSISFFSPDELAGIGVPPEQISAPGYVPAKALVPEADWFDPLAFGISEPDAALMDPQFRLFLEIAWEALDNAGYAEDEGRRTGVFAGANANTYHEYLRSHQARGDAASVARAMLLNQGDFLSAWTSYTLNLTGPSLTVQTACSTSLAAVHLACQSLLNGECDLAVAGGVSLSLPQRTGYRYIDGGLLSPDGRCRAFDADAQGFVPGEAAGAVVLKRLDEAVADRDTIRAVIAGSAMNNDGSNKIGFTAPGQAGIAAAVAESLATAGIPCETIRMIEAHGAATTLGDPVEVAALTQVFRAHTSRRQFCALGSVKANIGHANAAAGIASLLKTVLALERGLIPPHPYPANPNPILRLPQTPFYLPSVPEKWDSDDVARRAGVSAFGIGGTNVHVTLEQAPAPIPSPSVCGPQLLVFSARTATALDVLTDRLAGHLEAVPGLALGDVAFTLAVGRRRLEQRRVVRVLDIDEAVSVLRSRDPERMRACREDGGPRKITFLFPHCSLAPLACLRPLYHADAVFRAGIDRCAMALSGQRGEDVRALFRPTEGGARNVDGSDAIPSAAIVAMQYALATALIARGIRPHAFIADGVGEIAAACATGLLSIEDAMLRADGGADGRQPAAAGPSSDAPAAQVAWLPASLGAWIDAGASPGPAFRPGASANRAAFNAAIASLLRNGDQAIIDLSAGDALTSIEGGIGAYPDQVLCAAVPDAAADPAGSWLLQILGTLWLRNAPIDWNRFYALAGGRRVPLPGYPFERRRYWVGEPDDCRVPSDEESAAAPDDGAAAYRAPANDLEAVVASIWAFHLGVDRVSTNESFLDLGGNSITATRIISTLRESLQVDLPLRALLENPTVTALAGVVERSAEEWGSDAHLNARMLRAVQQATGTADA